MQKHSSACHERTTFDSFCFLLKLRVHRHEHACGLLFLWRLKDLLMLNFQLL